MERKNAKSGSQVAFVSNLVVSFVKRIETGLELHSRNQHTGLYGQDSARWRRYDCPGCCRCLCGWKVSFTAHTHTMAIRFLESNWSSVEVGYPLIFRSEVFFAVLFQVLRIDTNSCGRLLWLWREKLLCRRSGKKNRFTPHHFQPEKYAFSLF